MKLTKLEREHRDLLAEIDRAIALADDRDSALAHAAGVSSWSVLDHLEHLRRADETIVRWIEGVLAGTVESDGKGRTIPGSMVLRFGRIPRGRGQAPDPTRPRSPDREGVSTGLESVRKRVSDLAHHLEDLARSDVTRRHPVLGCYSAAQWIRFAAVHHRHHRRIVQDILQAVQAAGGRPAATGSGRTSGRPGGR